MKKTRLKTRTWVLILAGILCLCLLVIFTSRRTPRLTAGIYVDGVLVRRVDLNRVQEEEHYRVESHGGFNEILIQPGRICVASADCPDKICVVEGWLPDFGLPIACIPHNLLILMEEDSP